VNVPLDTNVLVYAEGVNGPGRRQAAFDLVRGLPRASTFIPVQTLGELFRVLVRRASWSPSSARTAILSWGDTFPLIETSPDVLLGAVDLAADHQLAIWDAVIVAAAADARCRLLLSEDLQEGFTWGGVTVTNPFSTSRHPLLQSLTQPE